MTMKKNLSEIQNDVGVYYRVYNTISRYEENDIQQGLNSYFLRSFSKNVDFFLDVFLGKYHTLTKSFTIEECLFKQHFEYFGDERNLYETMEEAKQSIKDKLFKGLENFLFAYKDSLILKAVVAEKPSLLQNIVLRTSLGQKLKKLNEIFNNKESIEISSFVMVKEKVLNKKMSVFVPENWKELIDKKEYFSYKNKDFKLLSGRIDLYKINVEANNSLSFRFECAINEYCGNSMFINYAFDENSNEYSIKDEKEIFIDKEKAVVSYKKEIEKRVNILNKKQQELNLLLNV